MRPEEKKETLEGIMKKVLLAAVAISSLSLAVVSPAYAARHHRGMDSLVINVTTTSGTTWGAVTIDYVSGGKTHMLASCHKAKCTVHPPRMVKLTLTERAKSTATWPFHAWQLKNGGSKKVTKMGKTLKFEIKGGMATVWANYILK